MTTDPRVLLRQEQRRRARLDAERQRRAEQLQPAAAQRRRLLTGAGLGSLALAAGWLGLGGEWLPPAQASAAREPHAFGLEVDAARLGAPINRRLLGHNLQWVDRGDDLLREDGSFEPALLSKVQALGPTMLRFPGGAQSDVYHWQKGIGPQAQRGDNEHFHARSMQRSIMGTPEFLALCAATGAEPLITVNVPSGTPDEAARWLHATNVVGFVDEAGKALPRVRFWEIGNEPYLKDEAQPALSLEPEAYARRADAIIRALRAVDPAIQIGLPVTNQLRNGVPVAHFADWLPRVLATLTERVDFACVHNGYMPFVQQQAHDRDRSYWAAMAGSRGVQADLEALRRRLAELRPGQDLPLALTEYNAIFSLGQGVSDNWVSSPAGALYVADLLRMLSTRPEVLMAHLWSLSGNWRFGAIGTQTLPGGHARPVAQVLQLMGQLLRGQHVAFGLRAATVATQSAGLVPAQAALPLVEALVTRDGQPFGQPFGHQLLRVMLLNKDPLRAAQGALNIAGLASAQVAEARLTQLVSPADVLMASDEPGLMQQLDRVLSTDELPAGRPLQLSLPPASLTLLTLQLRAGAPGSSPSQKQQPAVGSPQPVPSATA